MLVYLADLTHTGQLVASNVFPLGIGLIGANILKEIPDATVELFKYPDDLARAVHTRQPHVLGLSNYSWNCNIGHEYARRIKEAYPQVVVIAGGPNYGSTHEEHQDYWQRFPFVDFYIYKEGERSTVELLKRIFRITPNWGQFSPSVHCLYPDGSIHKNDLMPRVKSLDELPSPYTAGLMDKFFDGILIPMTHTTRGCPFKCSFCTEGTSYYDKVAKRTTLSEDLEYIGQRKGTIQDLYISDANFGMFAEDKLKAEAIADVQERYDWPRYIHVSGGKNHKERVLEVAGIIGKRGGMGVAASLQSTNKAVLANVRRDNISVDQLAAVAKEGSRQDANTYSEIILNLPGDTVEAHTQSLRDSVNAGLSYLRMYQLIMLPETDLNTRETRERFGMKCMWRIMPRCFGRYSFEEEEFNCAEIEEICVEQKSLSFSGYLECRELDLTIEIAHNANIFRELFGLCHVAGVDWFDLLLGFHEKRHLYLPDVYRAFRQNTVKPLWESRTQALDFAQAHLDQYLDESLGVNELFNGKAVAFFNKQKELHQGIYDQARIMMPQYGDYLDQAEDFSLQRKEHLLDGEPRHQKRYDYDFIALLGRDFTGDPDRHRGAVTVDFSHSPDQRATIDQLVHQYGTSNTGLGRILLRAHVKKLFRNVTANGVTTSAGFEQSYRRSTNLGD